MTKPWNFVKSFERKSFEQSSKETNNSVPIKTEVIVSVEEVLVVPEIILPPEQPVVEVMVPVEKPKRKKGRKNEKNKKS